MKYCVQSAALVCSGGWKKWCRSKPGQPALYTQYFTLCTLDLLGQNLGFVVPCIFNHSNKTPNQMQQSIVKFYCFVVQTLLNMEVFSAVVPRLRTLPPPHSYGNQRLQRQFDGLLMMGMVMPETCRAVSARQSNKFYD